MTEHPIPSGPLLNAAVQIRGRVVTTVRGPGGTFCDVEIAGSLYRFPREAVQPIGRPALTVHDGGNG